MVARFYFPVMHHVNPVKKIGTLILITVDVAMVMLVIGVIVNMLGASCKLRYLPDFNET